MSNIITIGYSTEGTTDRRFLESIIKRTFEEVAFTCEAAIEVFDPMYIDFPKGNGFAEGIKKISEIAFEKGHYVFCIHADADDSSDNNTFLHKINPAKKLLLADENINTCKNLVTIVPIYMTEAWMLADKDLFRSEISSEKNNNELKINRDPETIANPKFVIEEALRISQEGLTTRRRKLTIDEIYQPIGQNISLEKLETLSSYIKFKEAVTQAFVYLNYLHD